MQTLQLSRTFLLVLAVSLAAQGQTITGSVTGSVTDTSGGAIPNASVTLKSETTAESRSINTNETGDYVFNAVIPGSYVLRIEKEGFNTIERPGLVLTATQRLAVGSLQMPIGALSERVTIEAVGAMVQTASSGNSAALSGKQLNLLVTRGRDVISLLRVLPGVAGGSDENALGGTFGTNTPNIGGQRNGMNTMSADGQSGNDADGVGGFNGMTSLDAISEVQVLLNTYQAEYGRNAGASINLVTKGGTRDFHGSAYWYARNEFLNANDFFNNRNSQKRPLYRYNTFGGTIGGPVYIPGKFNPNRDKLFFFYSREDWRISEPRNVRRVTMPTLLERQGDFSRTLDVSGQLIRITDPTTGQPFAGNIVPPSRINRNGQAILNLFPMPNFLDRNLSGGNYNYQFQEITEHPKKLNTFKADYNLTLNDRISARYTGWWADRRGYEGLAAFNSNWDQLLHHYLFKTDQIQTSYTKIIRPNMINEAQVGYRKLGEIGDAMSSGSFDNVTRSKVGLGTLGQLYKEGNPLDIVPQANFGGVPSAANIAYDGRLPIAAEDWRWNYNDTLSWIRGAHSLKFGISGERQMNSEGPRSNFGGAFNFDRNVNNPLDANYAYANAVLGNFSSYSESSARSTGLAQQSLVEWFAQDSWKASRRLTLDFGIRFTWFTPWRVTDGKAAALALERYDPSKAPQFIQPVLNAAGVRSGRNPITNEILPAVSIGSFVPGTGDPANGMVVSGTDILPNGFANRGLEFGPRFGFAYDVLGDGKTAIRGGFGVSKQAVPGAGSYLWTTRTNPPVQYNPQIFYGNLDTLLSSSGTLFPSSVSALERNPKAGTVMNYSLAVQRDLGWNTVLDVSYVGNRSQHLQQTRDLNTVPYGARFASGNSDPSAPGRPLPDNFFRPFPGYGSITYIENSGYGNYNALQTSLNRRMSQSLQFGVAYTWSKAMDLTSGDNGLLPMYRPYRDWLYGKSNYDQTHVFVFNYLWDLPKASTQWNNGFARTVLDSWQVSGIVTMASGTPRDVGYSTVDGADITGGGDGARINVTDSAILSKSDRTFNRFFNTSVFSRPGRGDFGNAPKDIFRGPGINNWDVSLFKKFPFKNESRYLQFRWEFYNAFNHTQFSNVDNGARFDLQGNQVNTQFGRFISARSPRVMQGALNLTF
ncbi:MAG: TonB-dependent receptor [Bryobacteraceae bacterium]|nr:TonB-dependent receptor [Bryobacteraceae bacterium]